MESSDESVVEALLLGEAVTLNATGEGVATIAAEARDPRGGRARHEFEVSVACEYVVSPERADVLWMATSVAFDVDASPGCAWTATEGEFAAPEIAGRSVIYQVEENTGAPRADRLPIAEQEVMLYQASPSVFTDHPIERGVTPVRAIHFLELRGAHRHAAEGLGAVRVRVDGRGAGARRDAGEGRAPDGAAGGAGRGACRRRAYAAYMDGRYGDGGCGRHPGGPPDGVAAGCRPGAGTVAPVVIYTIAVDMPESPAEEQRRPGGMHRRSMPRGSRLGSRHGLRKACWSRRPLFLSVLACLCVSAGNAGAQGSVAGDRAVLEVLFNATGGSNWDHATNWLTEAPLRDWDGIETDADGRVTIVSLADNGLTGPIPTELGQLDRLEELWLTSNALRGEIPAALGNLASLEVLSLAANRLSGEIPAALGSLTSLEQLNLNDNALSGSIPMVLGSLSNLVDLSLDDNALSGPLPAGLGNLSRLRWLDFARNALSGSLPADLNRLSSLLRLWIEDNALSGPIPTWLGSLGSLAELNLAGNELTGAVPDTLGDLTDLATLYLNDNAALKGPLPLRLASLVHLRSVDVRNTGACGPEDDAFEAWAATIDFRGCSGPAPPPSDGGGGGGGGGGGASVTVSFALPGYTAAEGEPGVPVMLRLSAASPRTVTIPLTTTHDDGATADDYAVDPASVTFASRSTEAAVTVTAVDDDADDDGESVVLGLGPLPRGVSVGEPAIAAVALVDNDVTVTFARPVYAASEGGPAVPVTVRLSSVRGREVTIPLTVLAKSRASASDYEGVPASVTFGGTEAERTFRVTALADAEDDDGESVSIGFGPLASGVVTGTPSTATVAIADAGGPGFTDELSAGGPVRAVHLVELRLRIAALRLRLGLAPFAWTDAVVEAGVTPVRAVHLMELRTAVAEAYDKAAQPPPRYTDASARPGATLISAEHFLELRNAIVAAERRSR